MPTGTFTPDRGVKARGAEKKEIEIPRGRRIERDSTCVHVYVSPYCAGVDASAATSRGTVRGTYEGNLICNAMQEERKKEKKEKKAAVIIHPAIHSAAIQRGTFCPPSKERSARRSMNTPCDGYSTHLDDYLMT